MIKKSNKRKQIVPPKKVPNIMTILAKESTQ